MNLRRELADLGEAVLWGLVVAVVALGILQEIAAKVCPLPVSPELRNSIAPVSPETP